jgi:hypothetical protein
MVKTVVDWSCLILAGYFMFGGAQMSQETKDKVSVINSLMIVA